MVSERMAGCQRGLFTRSITAIIAILIRLKQITAAGVLFCV
jgi:hypothetical protein